MKYNSEKGKTSPALLKLSVFVDIHSFYISCALTQLFKTRREKDKLKNNSTFDIIINNFNVTEISKREKEMLLLYNIYLKNNLMNMYLINISRFLRLKY